MVTPTWWQHAPSNPNIGDAFYETYTGASFFWDGSEWKLFSFNNSDIGHRSLYPKFWEYV